MNQAELERRLGEVLRERAEDTMNDTDTQARLETLQNGLERDGQTRRGRVALVVGLAAAAAVTAALVRLDSPGAERSDAPAGSGEARAAEQVASDFVDAVATYDAPRATSYLADGAEVEFWLSTWDADGLARELQWTRAAEVRMRPGPCEYDAASTVVCSFEFDALGSEELGRGPFLAEGFRLTVVDGEIVGGELQAAWDSTGFAGGMWEPFTAWLLSNHADDAGLMYADWPGAMKPALNDRSARLWAKYVDGYVSAVQRGQAY